jgi:hypothetical protein
MRSRRLPAFLLPLLLPLSFSHAAQVSVSGRRLLVDGTPFVLKGVNYSPVRAGANAVTYDVFADTQTWEGDFRLLRAMGANTLRLQHAVDATPGFLDAAHAAGFHVVMGYFVPTTVSLSDNVALAALQSDFLVMVNAWKGHPAVLMWSLGNEVGINNSGSLANWYAFLDSAATAAKSADPNHPVSTAVADTGDVSTYDGSVPALDLWGVNVYRGASFGNAFTTLSGATSKPVWFSEFGCDAYNTLLQAEDQSTQADYLASQWEEIRANLSADAPARVLAGAAVFAWSDEWWKGRINGAGAFGAGGNMGVSVQDSTADWTNDAYPADQASPGTPNMQEEWWGIVGISSGTSAPAKRLRRAYHVLRGFWNTSVAGGVGPVFSGAVVNAPNPVAPGGSTTFYVPAEGTLDRLSLDLYDASYRKVTGLSWSSGTDPQGNPAYTAVWDGRVDGAPAAPGVYVLRVEAAARDREDVKYRKVVVVP